jgi:hypothetical protein
MGLMDDWVTDSTPMDALRSQVSEQHPDAAFSAPRAPRAVVLHVQVRMHRKPIQNTSVETRE